MHGVERGKSQRKLNVACGHIQIPKVYLSLSYRAVVLSAWNASPYLLSRSILYTAITRARTLLIIVGREETIAQMVGNAKVGRRYTGLKLRLQNKAG